MMTHLSITARLEKLKEYTNYLKGYQKKSLAEIKTDYTLQGAILHYLQLSIECVMDIGELLISELGHRKPQGAQELFMILAEGKVISHDFALKLVPMTSFRNILVHEYTEIDLEKVFLHLQNDLNDLDVYSQGVAQFLKHKK